MKIHVISDVHLEFEAYSPPKLDVDVIILAGDIDVGVSGVAWAQNTFPETPVIYVPGNHEYYNSVIQESYAAFKSQTSGSNVHVLDNDLITIGEVQFLGCTLWTDFNLHGQPRSAKNLATRYINDYEAIEYGLNHRKLRTHDTFVMHQKSVQWLNASIDKTSTQSVIITHHAPSAKSLPENFVNEGFGATYASSLDNLVLRSKSSLWVHGHIHTSSDYSIGQTRVVCNPRGYSDHENPKFDPNLIIEI
jgi:Icc-related predicted phosphoesterase